MIEIAAGDSLVVRVARYAEGVEAEGAGIAVGIADPERAAAMATAIAGPIAEVVAGTLEVAAERPVVRLRARKAVARDPGRLAGAIAIVPVTARNARHLVALVDSIRSAGAAGIQLVWDGAAPPRDRIECHVFAALERARQLPGTAPVVLAASERPASALRLLITHRSQTQRPEAPP